MPPELIKLIKTDTLIIDYVVKYNAFANMVDNVCVSQGRPVSAYLRIIYAGRVMQRYNNPSTLKKNAKKYNNKKWRKGRSLCELSTWRNDILEMRPKSSLHPGSPPPFLNILKMTFAGFEPGTFSRQVRRIGQLAKKGR